MRARALGAVLGGAVGDAPLGRELALDLGAADGGGALLRRGAALLDQPGGAALGLGGGGALAVGLAARRGRLPRAIASAAATACAAASTALIGLLLGLHRRSDSAMRESRRLRSARTRSWPPVGAWRSSRVAANQARPVGCDRDAA